MTTELQIKIADLEAKIAKIVAECADAADMAYDARCKFPGDYVVEQMGYGKEEGASAWRSEQQRINN